MKEQDKNSSSSINKQNDRRWIDRSIIIIGIIHIPFGTFFLREVERELLSDGLFNTVNGQPEREAYFWFMFSGLMVS